MCSRQGSLEKQNEQEIETEAKRERQRERETDYMELAHTIMGADMSQDLQGESASWRCRRANGIVPSLRPRKSGRFSGSQRQEKAMSQFKCSQARSILSCSGKS